MDKKRAMLVILDGWGIAKDPSRSAIDQAKTPFMDSLYNDYPHSTLVTYGTEVGLPEGQMGNSEVGHLNLGAGRIVYQDLQKINKAIEDNELETNIILRQSIDYCKENKRPVHLMGLVSDGGVHAHIDHLKALIAIYSANKITVYIHAFLDGRDTSPHNGIKYVADLLAFNKNHDAHLASVIGRFYAMDRDNRWERIKKAYDLIVGGEGLTSNDFVASIKQQYDKEITDEFMEPLKNRTHFKPIAENDCVLFFNYRTDRPRQITEALTIKDFPDQNMRRLPLKFYSMTSYNESFTDISVLFPKDNLKNTLGEVISDHGLSQVRIAETEKYPHVTFFFSGGREKPFKNEKRILVPSPKVATYDLQPEMSAREITDKIIAEIEAHTPDFICLNYANTDMVGHTGDFNAAKVATITVDTQLKRLSKAALKEDYYIFIIADHGNSDIMVNEDGSAHTAHTTNLVPFILASNNTSLRLSNGKLGDLAPSILEILGIEPSKEMDGISLLSK